MNLEVVSGWEPFATTLAAEEGIEARSEFRVGDLLLDPWVAEPADVVALQRVVCCNPDGVRLAGLAAGLAQRVLVLSYPREAVWTRWGVSAANLLERVRRQSFRAFVHPPTAILAAAVAQGLELVHRERGAIWESAALRRAEAETSASGRGAPAFRCFGRRGIARPWILRLRSRRRLDHMSEIGLFPLGIVLLPTEQVPLHIFEDRYKELIGECLAEEREFGLVYADDDGLRQVGTLAAVTEVLERFDDGRLNIVVEGRSASASSSSRVVGASTRPRSSRSRTSPTGASEQDVERALSLFHRLVELTGTEVEEPDPAHPQLSYSLAARFDFAAPLKQELLQETSERVRMHRVCAACSRPRQR